MTTTTDIACLEITLDDVAPVVMRRVEVPLTIRLDRLHAVLQAAMGWTNSHLWEFRAADAGWGIPDPDWGEGPNDAAKAKLIDVLEDTGTKRMTYLMTSATAGSTPSVSSMSSHPSPVRATRSSSRRPAVVRPRTSEGRQATRNTSKPSRIPATRHAEFTECYDANFDPAAVDTEVIRRELATLAKRWSRPSRKRKAG
jgi:hypothetical protein